MSKQAKRSKRHRYTGLVHGLYALAFAFCVAWCVTYTMDMQRISGLFFALCSSIPLVAYVIDVLNTEPSEEETDAEQ